MTAIIRALSWLANFLTGAVASRTALKFTEFAAYKVLYVLLIVTVLPYALFQFGSYLFTKFLVYFGSQTSSLEPITLQATGMLAWLLDCFQVPYCLSIILSAFVARYSIRFMRYVLFWK